MWQEDKNPVVLIWPDSDNKRSVTESTESTTSADIIKGKAKLDAYLTTMWEEHLSISAVSHVSSSLSLRILDLVVNCAH